MNIFEGSRRILYAVTAVAILLPAWEAWSYEPFIEAGTYQVMSSGDAVAINNCPNNDASRVNAGIRGAEVIVLLCGDGHPREVRLDKLEVARLKGEIASARIEQSKGLALEVAIGLASLWIISLGAGWIVRGFMGIPRGADKKT